MIRLGAIPREEFGFSPIPARVLFGSGTRERISEELDRAGISNVMVLTTPQQAQLGADIAERLGSRVASTYNGAAMHTPLGVTEEAMIQMVASKADGVLSIGGGSTIGLGKAIAARTGVQQVVLPTTYAGSEMTPILGETVDGIKTTRSGPEIQPEIVIYDVDLTLGLPVSMSVTSGFNAIAHAIEALYAVAGNPVIDALAVQAIEALVQALPLIVDNPENREGREAALYGAWLSGICLGSVGMALHHKLCHTLGGSFGLPHAETHTVVLPHALAYNASAVPSVIKALVPILGEDPAQGLQDLARRLGAPIALRDLGMKEDGISRAVQLALSAQYPNPRPLEAEALKATLQRAWAGMPVAA